MGARFEQQASSGRLLFQHDERANNKIPLMASLGVALSMRALDAKPGDIVNAVEGFRAARIPDASAMARLAHVAMLTSSFFSRKQMLDLLSALADLGLRHEALLLNIGNNNNLISPSAFVSVPELLQLANVYARFRIAVPRVRNVLTENWRRVVTSFPKLTRIGKKQDQHKNDNHHHDAFDESSTWKGGEDDDFSLVVEDPAESERCLQTASKSLETLAAADDTGDGHERLPPGSYDTTSSSTSAARQLAEFVVSTHELDLAVFSTVAQESRSRVPLRALSPDLLWRFLVALAEASDGPRTCSSGRGNLDSLSSTGVVSFPQEDMLISWANLKKKAGSNSFHVTVFAPHYAPHLIRIVGLWAMNGHRDMQQLRPLLMLAEDMLSKWSTQNFASGVSSGEDARPEEAISIEHEAADSEEVRPRDAGVGVSLSRVAELCHVAKGIRSLPPSEAGPLRNQVAPLLENTLKSSDVTNVGDEDDGSSFIYWESLALSGLIMDLDMVESSCLEIASKSRNKKLRRLAGLDVGALGIDLQPEEFPSEDINYAAYWRKLGAPRGGLPLLANGALESERKFSPVLPQLLPRYVVLEAGDTDCINLTKINYDGQVESSHRTRYLLEDPREHKIYNELSFETLAICKRYRIERHLQRRDLWRRNSRANSGAVCRL
ncbi:unnamed protein product [Amoebophrya sp. A25]|nr:unnamed protein product [Amoebophrya sp. A25]|eukprot:GSA25T00001131001.1